MTYFDKYIKYLKSFNYLPLNANSGFSFDILQIKIKKVNKIQITDDVFYYLIEGS